MLQLNTQNRSQRVWSRECDTMRISDAISFVTDFLIFGIHNSHFLCVHEMRSRVCVLVLASALNWMKYGYNASRKPNRRTHSLCHLWISMPISVLYLLWHDCIFRRRHRSQRSHRSSQLLWIRYNMANYSQFNWRYLVNECTVMQRHCHCRRRRQLSIVSNRMGWQKVGQRGWTRLHLRDTLCSFEILMYGNWQLRNSVCTHPIRTHPKEWNGEKKEYIFSILGRSLHLRYS